MKIPAPSRCLLLPPPTTRCCSGDLGPNPSRPATAPPLSEFAISASGEVDIDQLSGMPSKQSTMGERHALPAGMRNPVTSVIRSSLGLSAPKRCLPSSSRSRFGGASETSPSQELRRGPGESPEAIQPGLAEQGILTRTGPLYGRAYLTEQRTTPHGGARPSLCFTRYLLLAIRNRLVDKLVECCALLGGADGSHDWIPYDVAVLVDNVGGREREQV